MLSAGIEKLFWFDGMDNFFYHFHVTKNLFDYSQPRPAAVAFAVLTEELDNLRFESETNVPSGNGRVLRFSDSLGERVVCVAYANAGETFTVEAEEGQSAIDYLGQTILPDGKLYVIGQNPIYIRD
jgi:hypothetical protein